MSVQYYNWSEYLLAVTVQYSGGHTFLYLSEHVSQEDFFERLLPMSDRTVAGFRVEPLMDEAFDMLAATLKPSYIIRN